MFKKKNKIIYYLSAEHIIELNKLAITLFIQKRADKHEIFSYSKILKVVDLCKETKGDVYDKATALLKSLVKNHAFASANRRTAVLAIFVFCKVNKHNIYIPNNPTNSRILIGIREDFYEDKEIKNWLKNGKIRTAKQ